MPLDLTRLLALKARDERVEWGERDTLTYALATGIVTSATAQREVAFASEIAGPRIVPTFASTLATSRFLAGSGWNAARVVPLAERLVVHRPLAPAGALLLDSDVRGAFDRGADAGAVVVTEMRARAAQDGAPLFTVERTWHARGDGGFGPSAAGEPRPHPIPARPPDLVSDCATRPDQALLYRLLGDRNALHADPAAAAALGLPAPVLHGLCTFGIGCVAVLRAICEFDPLLIGEFGARFTGPVFPGVVLRAEFWQDAAEVSFRLTDTARGRVVLDHGLCRLRT